MKFEVNGNAHRILDDFIHYATFYPERMASSMSYYEEAFISFTRQLKKAYDEAMLEEARRSRYRGQG